MKNSWLQDWPKDLKEIADYREKCFGYDETGVASGGGFDFCGGRWTPIWISLMTRRMERQ